MKEQFTTTVPLAQFKVVKTLMIKSDIIRFYIANPQIWHTEIIESSVKFTYIGEPKDIPHDLLESKFQCEWYELLQLTKQRFADAFLCDVKEHEAKYYVNLLYGDNHGMKDEVCEAKEVKRHDTQCFMDLLYQVASTHNIIQLKNTDKNETNAKE